MSGVTLPSDFIYSSASDISRLDGPRYGLAYSEREQMRMMVCVCVCVSVSVESLRHRRERKREIAHRSQWGYINIIMRNPRPIFVVRHLQGQLSVCAGTPLFHA